MVFKLEPASGSPDGLHKTRIAGPTSVSNAVKSGVGPKGICISHGFPGYASAGWRSHFEKHCSLGRDKKMWSHKVEQYGSGMPLTCVNGLLLLWDICGSRLVFQLQLPH